MIDCGAAVAPSQRSVLAALFLFGWVVLGNPATASDFSGPAVVTSGDTMLVGKIRVKLAGVDAPEAIQTCRRIRGGDWDCGQVATEHLRKLVDGRQITCTPVALNRKGRTMARCRIGATDLGSAMVKAGLALAFRQYSTRYVPEEDEARRLKRGIWVGHFVAPWIWRAVDRGEFPRATPPPQSSLP